MSTYIFSGNPYETAVKQLEELKKNALLNIQTGRHNRVHFVSITDLRDNSSFRVFAPTLEGRHWEYITTRKDLTFNEVVDRLPVQVITEAQFKSFTRTPEFRRVSQDSNYAGFFSSPVVGSVMEHRWANRKLGFTEWQEAYHREVFSAPNIYGLAQSIKKTMNTTSLDFAFNLIMSRLFFQSNAGFENELKGEALLQEQVDPNIVKTSHETDAKYQVDFENDTTGWQLKPASWFRKSSGNQRQSLITTLRKNTEWTALTGKPVLYFNGADVDNNVYRPYRIEEVAVIADVEIPVLPPVQLVA